MSLQYLENYYYLFVRSFYSADQYISIEIRKTDGHIEVDRFTPSKESIKALKNGLIFADRLARQNWDDIKGPNNLRRFKFSSQVLGNNWHLSRQWTIA